MVIREVMECRRRNIKQMGSQESWELGQRLPLTSCVTLGEFSSWVCVSSCRLKALLSRLLEAPSDLIFSNI